MALTLCYLLLAVAPLASLFISASPTRAFQQLAQLESLSAILLSFITSLVAVALAVLWGLPTALCLARVEFRGKQLMNSLLELPIALPSLVLRVALLLMWERQGLLRRFLAAAGDPLSFTRAAVVLAQFVVAFPFL